MSAGAPRLVFLSYARADGAALARRLQRDLEAAGWTVWLDRDRIAAGSGWSEEIERAIGACHAMVALLSTGSYASRVCRGEQLSALELGKPLVPVLVQAGARRPVYLAADHYLLADGDAAYATAWPELLRALEGGAAAALAPDYRRRVPSERPLPAVFEPRPAELAALRAAVIAEARSGASAALVALRGMGGSGKTVLAGALLRDDAVGRAFPDGRAWIEVGRAPADAELLQRVKHAARSLGEDFAAVATLREATGRLRALLADKAVLLVLDDVWSAADAQPFVVESPQSSVLLTTRSETVARGLGAAVVELPTMAPPAALALLARWSRVAPQALPPEAAAIADECGGLPVALAMVGASLAGKPPGTWARRLERLRAADLARIGIPLGDYPFPDVFKAIDASVAELAADDRARYLQLAVFADDAHVPPAVLARLWGVDRLDAEDLVEQWADLSLAAMDADGRLTLHDLQHDYLRQVAGGGLAALHAALLERYRTDCRGGWHEGPDDGYFHGQLARHLARAGRRDELAALRLDARWMDARLRFGGIEALTDDYLDDEPVDAAAVAAPDPADGAAADDEAAAVHDALRLAAHVLAADPLALAGQLHGRLLEDRRPRVAALLSQAAASHEGPWLQPLCASLEAPGGALVATFDGRGARVRGIAASADGARVAAATDQGLVFVLDAARGRVRQVVGRSGRPAARALALPDARTLLVLAEDGGIEVWDLGPGTLQAVHPTGDGRWKLWTQRGEQVALAGPRGAELRRWRDGALLLELAGGEVDAVDLDASGARLLAYERFAGRLRWLAVDGGAVLGGVEHDDDLSHANAVVLAADAACAWVADLGGSIFEVDLAAGTVRRELRHRLDALTALAVDARSERLVSGDEHGEVARWQPARDDACTVLGAHTKAVRAVALAGTAAAPRVASLGDDGLLKLWRLQPAAAPAEPPHAGLVLRVAANRDGTRLWSGDPRRWVRGWQVADRARPDATGYLLGEEKRWPCGFDPYGEFVALLAEDSGELRVLRLADGRESAAFDADGLNRVALPAPGGRALAWRTRPGALRLAWLGDDGRPQRERTLADDAMPEALAFSGSGRVLAAVLSHEMRHRLCTWSAETGEPLGELADAPGLGYGVALAVDHDGRRALVGPAPDGRFALVDLAAMQVVDSWRSHAQRHSPVPALAWAAEADVRAAADGETLLVWRPQGRGPLVWTADAPLTACAVSADGSTVIAGEETGRVHVLRVRGAAAGPSANPASG